MKNLELRERQLNGLTGNQYLMASRMNDEFMNSNDGLVIFDRKVGPPENSSNSCGKNLWTERFGDVIIGAHFQPRDDVTFFTLCCQDDDRNM